MKFLQIIAAAVFMAPAVMSVPVESTDQATTPVQAISNSITLLQNGLSQDEAAIKSAIKNAKGNVTATAQLAATVNANLQAISNGFTTSATSIVNSLQQAGQGAGGQVQALSQSEVASLTSSLTTLQGAVSGLGASLTFQATNLGPTVQAATLAEVTAVKQSIAPLINPVMTFANAASKASAGAGVTVTGLNKAYAGVVSAVNKFAAANGLPGISIPGVPAQ